LRKIWLTIILITICGILIIPDNPQKNEIEIKQSILQHDIEQTNELCRTQCSFQLNRLLSQPNIERSALSELQNKYPHMVQIHLIKPGQTLQTGIKTGKIEQNLENIVKDYQQQALQVLKTKNHYESPQLHHKNEKYFVLGAASENRDQFLVGLVHQEILNQIEIEERKNLRLVPYPSDKRYKIKSVDSDQLIDVPVRNAEENQGVSHYHNQQVVVKFLDSPTAAQLKQIKAEIQPTLVKKSGYTYVFQSKKMTAEQLMNYFRKWNIQYVEPHFLYMTNEFIPNDALFQEHQWNLPIIDTINGWDLTKGSEDIIVAVIDTGVDLNHDDLANQLVKGYNAVDEQSSPMDDVGHGTHVAGVISAVVNNTEGVAGMSWYNKVMPIKVLDHTGSGSTYAVAQGIIWATDHGAKVINMSLGNYANAEFLHDAVKYAFDHDVVLIAATGNDNTQDPGYPAAYPEVLAVSATDWNQNRASFSNYGNYVDVMAPGENIASTYPDNQYAALSGTSMASPHAAALAAMIRSTNPLLTNTEVMQILRQTSVDLGNPGRDPYYGFGQIDVVTALKHANQTRNSLTLWSRLLKRELQQIDLRYEGR
jgi:thermitase